MNELCHAFDERGKCVVPVAVLIVIHRAATAGASRTRRRALRPSLQQETSNTLHSAPWSIAGGALTCGDPRELVSGAGGGGWSRQALPDATQMDLCNS